jgi:hypothetical protein
MSLGTAARKNDPEVNQVLVVSPITGITGELTNSDAILVPFHNEHSPTLFIEERAVRCPTPFSSTTAGVVVDE